jgi:hypothetical protein
MYPLILSFETINKLNLFFECGVPRPQDVGHLCLGYCKFLTQFIISIAMLENVPPCRRVTEKSHLFHTKRRSGQDQESNPGQLRGKQRH